MSYMTRVVHGGNNTVDVSAANIAYVMSAKATFFDCYKRIICIMLNTTVKDNI